MTLDAEQQVEGFTNQSFCGPHVLARFDDKAFGRDI